MAGNLSKKTTKSAQSAMAEAQPRTLAPTGVVRSSSTKLKIKKDKPITPDKAFSYGSPNA
jgi:hypothetical protein